MRYSLKKDVPKVRLVAAKALRLHRNYFALHIKFHVTLQCFQIRLVKVRDDRFFKSHQSR